MAPLGGALVPRDGVKERAADVVPASAGATERRAFGIGEVDQRRIIAGFDQARVVKLVSPDQAAGSAQRPIGEQSRLAIAEVKFAPREARRVAEQPDHCVPLA